ncbi:adenylate/guanylate cyclase family protein [Motilibacter peucedani]|uniref:Adenylate/guanylate cyclase family protein n=1 Tax=Motilibacter peucedani TaxID=598650 RepID=A0A420XKG5_9ACTN|nr:tetratricopeptide repeat protein [Motilibacter peucedani]RKS68005.1 adenylate/guanylate cyclase family protein [Motilibacter peucedani]
MDHADLLPADNVQAYIPGDRRRALADGAALPERVRGAALFADISGFTPLTETLAAELGPARGAEEVTAALEQVFDALLGVLDAHGGEAIYFSGDAVTCWLDGDDGTRATACGLAMQDAIERVGERTTPGGRSVRLRLKVAVAVGAAHRFVVGDPGIQLIDVLAGRVVDALAVAEGAALPGQVVLDPGAVRSVGSAVELDGAVALRTRHRVRLPEQRPSPPRLPERDVRSWVLPSVYERLTAGRGEFLADLRPAVPVFVRFGGLDFDDDPGAPAALDALVTRAQRIVHANGGNVLQLTIGDKGAYLYAVFGAPVAHEDDAARACASALELLATDPDGERGLAVGLSTGRLRSGTYGSAERRTFCCLGDAVNLAARLMTAAPGGTVWVSDELRRAAGEGFVWEELAPVAVKGKAQPVAAWRLLDRLAAPPPRARRYAGPMLGRSVELAALVEAAELAASGSGQVVQLVGEAGLGKSRLLAALSDALAAREVPVHEGVAPAFGADGGYGGWRPALRSALGLSATADATVVEARARELLLAADPTLLPRLPLVGAVLGVEIAHTALTASFDAKLRKTSLEALVVQYLLARPQDSLLVLVLEDAQWLDSLSLDLLATVARAAARLPLLLVVSGRPAPGPDAALPSAEHVRRLELRELDEPTALRLARLRVEDLTGHPADEVAPDVLRSVVSRASGNPFHVEELLAHLVDRGVDLRSAASGTLELPSSLQRLVLTRIDDLAEHPRRTVKVASVVGRRFGTDVLAGAYPELGGDDDVRGSLADPSLATLVLPEPEPGRYAFRHAMTEEVAYASLPFATRRVLHDRIGGWIERTSGDAALDLLAHHFGRGSDAARKRDYLVRAGEAAQARYANDAAVAYYRQALEVVLDDDRPSLLERLGKVLELRGQWAEARETYLEAWEGCTAQGDRAGAVRVLLDLAEVARKQGRFPEAAERLAEARERELDEAELAAVLHLEGTLASQQGRYAEARTAYRRSLEVRDRLGDRAAVGALLSNLAVVAEQEGDLDQAWELGSQALAVREEVGDPWAVCVSRNNLGMVALLRHDYEQATEHVEESMRLAAQVGDLWVVAVGEHNLGNALLGLDEPGEAAWHYRAALQAYLDHDDSWSLALLVEDVVALAAREGAAEDALTLLGAADALRDELGAERPPATERLLADAMAGALQLPGADGLVEAGRALDRTGLVSLVRRIAQ